MHTKTHTAAIVAKFMSLHVCSDFKLLHSVSVAVGTSVSDIISLADVYIMCKY